MDSDTTEKLKYEVRTYSQLKEEIKNLTEQKKKLEQVIIETMNQFNIDALELPDGKMLNYQMKEVISIDKDKKRKGKKNAQ